MVKLPAKSITVVVALPRPSVWGWMIPLAVYWREAMVVMPAVFFCESAKC